MTVLTNHDLLEATQENNLPTAQQYTPHFVIKKLSAIERVKNSDLLRILEVKGEMVKPNRMNSAFKPMILP